MSEEDTASVCLPRSRIFVTTDGLFVVQWEQKRVQDLLSGRYLPFSPERFGSLISNYELSQLNSRGIVTAFDSENVWLMSAFSDWGEPSEKRAYYLYTHIPNQQLRTIENLLMKHNLNERFAVRAREQFLAIRDQNGTAFENVESAENARVALMKALPDTFSSCAVAFVDIVNNS